MSTYVPFQRGSFGVVRWDTGDGRNCLRIGAARLGAYPTTGLGQRMVDCLDDVDPPGGWSPRGCAAGFR